MSVPCTKCGAAIPAGSQFCTVCGTAVSSGVPQPASGYTPVNVPSQPAPGFAPANPPVQAAPPSAPLPGYTSVNPSGQPGSAPPASPPYTPTGMPVAPMMPPPPPASGGSSAVKVILIVIAIFVGLGIVGAGAFGYMVWRVGHAIHANSSTGEVSLDTPGGSFKAGGTQTYTSEELGTDIYPGAESGKGGMKMETPSGSMITGIFVTSDSKDAVRDFYKSKFGDQASVYDTADGAVMTVNKGPQESVMVTVSSKQSENDGKTKIVIVHTRNAKAS